MAQPQNVGRGEQPFNAATYKASHNSYEQNESLAQQIDDYNIWQLELDIYDYEGDLKVNHSCDAWAVHEAVTLPDLLNKMVAESQTYTYRFTIIYLDMKGNGLDGCLIANWGGSIQDRIKSAFIQSLGAEHIYPAKEFIMEDQAQWPSFQELVRRGYYWGVVVDWHGAFVNPAYYDDLLFYATSETLSLEYTNNVLVSIDGGNNDNYKPSMLPPPDKGARWLWRVYSDAGNCADMISTYWTLSVNNKFTFVATNCVNRDATMQLQTHSPSPLYVNKNAVTVCPVENEGCEWGTRAFPYHNLADAIARVSPMVTVLISSGVYPVGDVGTVFIINKPLILKATGGMVVITRK